MASFRTACEMLLLARDQDIINDEELLLLYDVNSSNNLQLIHTNYEQFDVINKEEAECFAEFRVKKRDLPLLADALGIPEKFKCPQGTVCSGMEGLCIFLRRFAYPCRYSDMVQGFGRSVPELGMISNTVLDYIYLQHAHRITEWNHTILSPANLQLYADAITAKGSPLQNCFGFIDGTVRPISRPSRNQRMVYNGHKRVHALKFQSVAIPNGLIANLFGPVGRYLFLLFIAIVFIMILLVVVYCSAL